MNENQKNYQNNPKTIQENEKQAMLALLQQLDQINMQMLVDNVALKIVKPKNWKRKWKSRK